ncbi:enoyl-CoA hydratase/isomerase family protein [Sphingobacterium sp. HJSM2_6]|uniref:enoyl-CoA hydratase/isomerase family protein n=1 Tax=Sphingobacterium sp. HJSM2_6 TaxID=3366264 RepID=UPI003BDB78F5
MSYQNLLIQHEGHTATIYIHREAKLNALNYATITELKQAFQALENNPLVWGVLLTGSGSKAFVAGADISEFQDKSPEEGIALARYGHELMDKIANFSKPVLAAINGFALGGGLELALSCHIRIASSQAKVGLPEVSLGLIPGYGGTQRLTALIGKGKAMEMILTGDMLTAQEALQWGLVNHVVEVEELIQTGQSILSKIYTRSKTAISAAIQAINAQDNNAVDGFEQEIKAFGQCFHSPDFAEGVQAFLEKRNPKF